LRKCFSQFAFFAFLVKYPRETHPWAEAVDAIKQWRKMHKYLRAPQDMGFRCCELHTVAS